MINDTRTVLYMHGKLIVSIYIFKFQKSFIRFIQTFLLKYLVKSFIKYRNVYM